MCELLPPEIWQEYDCPSTGLDFDIGEDSIVHIGESFYCPGCGEYHTACEGFPETCIRPASGAALQFSGPPADSEAKKALLSMIKSARKEAP